MADTLSAIRVLIADDEPLVRRDLVRLLASRSDVVVVGEARDGIEALEKIEELRPDVVFLDVQMPELDGFGVIAALENASPEIVFVTAYDAYAARAFDVHAVDYLLKPFDPTRLWNAVDRVRSRLMQSRADNSLAELSNVRIEALGSRMALRGESLQRLAVRVRGRIRYVASNDIEWIEAADNYAILHTNSERHLVRSTLRALSTALDQSSFVRTHRSYVVNVGHVLEVEPMFKGDAIVVMKSGDRVPLSRGYRDEFRRRMAG